MTENGKVSQPATTDVAALLRASEKFRLWKPVYTVRTTPKGVERSPLIKEKHWNVAEVAEQWGISTDLVRDIFKDEDGVLIVERPGSRVKRSYSTMRIPESVLERVYNQLSRR